MKENKTTLHIQILKTLKSDLKKKAKETNRSVTGLVNFALNKFFKFKK